MGKIYPILLLVGSNLFMTYAWYGHLKDFKGRALALVVMISWGIAFFEYCLQVPANRLGAGHYSLGQLKVIQEVVSLSVFAGFCALYMKEPMKLDYLWAALCIVGAVYFMFRGASAS
ncbi:MAG: DMT family protein [Planctomycetes bacterium]|nr:DMT family protein [Planctomycetota bacterium]